MERQNAATVAVLLLLFSYIILADEINEDFSPDNWISFTYATNPGHEVAYCDNFNRKEKNYTLRYPKVLKLDILAPYNLNRGSLTLISQYNYIEKIENEAFDGYKNLRKLEILVNSLQYIDDKVLTKKFATSLATLNLNENNLQNLPTTVFQYLINLRSLNLSHNPKINLWVLFNGVNVTIFHEALSELVHLDVSYCNIGYFDENVFVNLKNLKNLHMSGNPVTSIPMAIKSLSTLENLHIRDSQIEEINDCDFCNFAKLEILDLSGTKSLTLIHENAFGAISNIGMPQLKKFSIKSCNIQIIPEKFLNWANLESLDIRENPLKCDISNAWLINDIVTDSPSLLTDKIIKNWNWSDKNFLACNSPTTSKWSLLHILFGNMCFNGTTVYDATEKYDNELYYVCENEENENFPCKVLNEHDFECHSRRTHMYDSRGYHEFDYLFHNANIKILQRNVTLYNVYFEGQYEWETKLTILQKDKVLPGHESTIQLLSFRDNKISTIENGTFDKFISLKNLRLSYNDITDIDGLTFPSSLTDLYLNANKLKLTSSKPFENLHNLVNLSLAENPNILPINPTTTIFPTALSNLKHLSLRKCNISNLDDNIFIELVNLKYLYLGENPLTSIPTAINFLRNLKVLNISSSPNMTVLHRVGLAENPILTDIIAYSSKIQRIVNCAFCSFPNLKNLDLNFNSNLSFIHRNAFGSLSNQKPYQMDTLLLKSCNISYFHERLLDLDYAKNFEIEGNPIHCECPLIRHLSMFAGFDSLKCQSPAEFKGIPFYEFFDDKCFFKKNPSKQDHKFQDLEENVSKPVEEEEHQKANDDKIFALNLSPFDCLIVIFMLSVGELFIFGKIFPHGIQKHLNIFLLCLFIFMILFYLRK